MGKLCAHCGVAFDRPYSKSVWARVRYCSKPCAGAARARDVDARFDEKVTAEPNTGCFLWMGASGKRGYGSFGIDNHRTTRAHIFAYERANGPVPDGLVVCHKCDVPLCVNPQHLFAATQAVNLADAKSKGRTASGERSPWAKLTDEKVRAIRAWTGKLRDAAEHFGVAPPTITQVRNGRTWKHVR